MKLETMQMLESNLCLDIDQFAKKKNLDKGEIAVLESLVNIVYKLDKMSDSGRSGDGMWTAHGSYAGRNTSMNNSYGNDNSYNARMNDNYSYDNGRNGSHYVRGHYSHSSYGNEMVTERMREMMNDGRLNSEEKMSIQRAMEIMER